MPKLKLTEVAGTPRGLSEREKAFVERLPVMSPPQAAAAAGYSAPDEMKRLLQRPSVVLAMLAELQKREVKLAMLRVQAKGILSATMTCPADKKDGGPNWSDRVSAAKVVMDILKKEGKTLAEVAEDEDVAEETLALAQRVLALPQGNA